MRHDEALAAIRTEIARIAPEGPERYDPPPHIRERLGELVARGACTAAQAAEALVVSLELVEAEASGEVPVAHGLDLMRQLGERHRGKSGGTN